MQGNGIQRQQEVVVPNGSGAVVRTDAQGGMELSQMDGTAAALAAQAEADVKARWAIAQRVPRNLDGVRVKLLAECKRPAFARVARYAKPVGGQKITGPSIRFVEAALRCMGNIYAPTRVVREDRETRVVEVVVTDLETNISWPRQITIRKTVERKGDRQGNPPKDRQIIGSRTNSYGEKVYEVLATEDELANKEAAAISKAIRTAGLRILPGDIVEEAMDLCVNVAENEDARDPAAARKKLVDAFAAVGVTPERLVEYLGHALDALTPKEMADLRGIYEAIRDGESKWSDVMELKRDGVTGEVKAPPSPAPAPSAAQTATAPAPAPVTATATGSAVEAAPSAPAAKADPMAPTELEVLLIAIDECATPKDLDSLLPRISALAKGSDARRIAGDAFTKRKAALRG